MGTFSSNGNNNSNSCCDVDLVRPAETSALDSAEGLLHREDIHERRLQTPNPFTTSPNEETEEDESRGVSGGTPHGAGSNHSSYPHAGGRRFTHFLLNRETPSIIHLTPSSARRTCLDMLTEALRIVEANDEAV